MYVYVVYSKHVYSALEKAYGNKSFVRFLRSSFKSWIFTSEECRVFTCTWTIEF